MKPLSKFFYDTKGNLSSSRLVMLIITLWFILDWLITILNTGAYDLTWPKVTLVASGLGLKTVQKFQE